NHIEAAGVLGPARLLLQEQRCGVGELAALARVDAFQSATPGRVPPVADFDEYYCIAVEHDQIELAAPAQPVLCQQAQSVTLQMGAGQGLGLVAAAASIHQSAV